MQQKHNIKLIVKVLIVGAIIAVLSYLFHPGVGSLSVMLNGESVAESLVRFAAVPTFLLIMVITGVLMVLLFLGIGVFIFLCAMFVALLGVFVMAPYFWPVLVVVLMIALMSMGAGIRIKLPLSSMGDLPLSLLGSFFCRRYNICHHD